MMTEILQHIVVTLVALAAGSTLVHRMVGCVGTRAGRSGCAGCPSARSACGAGRTPGR